ncbi:MAG: siphovirus Gp157 family protein [Oculatellaceae cyanobacterium bins.114]|nr:siphovirus Gp157 family protein [Oculatellaceae cyanobacterium bins.114]
MSRTLIDISQDLLELEADLENLEGLPQEQVEELKLWFEELQEEHREARDRKLDNYAALIADLSARAEARRNEAKRLMSRAQTDEGKVRSLKSMLQWFFAQHGYTTIETDRYRLTLANSGGKAPLLLDEMPIDDFPPQFVKVLREPDKDAIREALETGQELDFARLGERQQSIRIK